MAKNTNGNTPTQEAIKKYRYDLCKEKVACNSEKEARIEDFDSKKEDEQYKICELVKAEDTREIYQNIDYTVGIGALKESELIKETLKLMDEQNSALVKQLQDAVKQIKDTKDKMASALEIVCKMDRCIEEEERCNIDIYNAFDEVPGFWKDLDKIMQSTNAAYNKINTAFDAVVDVSGIQTFANLEGLKEYNANMATAISNFKGDLEANIKSSGEKVKTASENFTLVLQDVTTANYEKSKASTSCEGKEKTYEFVNSIPCEDAESAMAKIKAACAKVHNDQIPDRFKVDECEESETSDPVS